MRNNKERWVIKAGSSLVAGTESGINSLFIESLVSQVNYLIEKDIEVIVVSSGAVGKGMQELNLKDRPSTLHLLQAAAAIGQMGLVNAYQKEFDKFGLKAAQVLISHDDISNRKRYLNARRSLETLLELNVMPIVNENDTTATTEIKYGDNDRLAARVSQIIGADCLILLSDVDGLYTDNPKKNKKTKLIKVVKKIDENIKKYASKAENIYGSGGMKTKIEAAKICQLSGCYMVITNGTHENPIKKISENQKCTWFLPKISKLDARKQWIIGSVAPRGEVIIDHGAIKAINNGKSLLPAGVKKINGTFEKGDHILVKDLNNVECARGLASFSSIEIEKIKGSHSSKIKNILGYSSREEIIHKDDLVKV